MPAPPVRPGRPQPRRVGGMMPDGTLPEAPTRAPPRTPAPPRPGLPLRAWRAAGRVLVRAGRRLAAFARAGWAGVRAAAAKPRARAVSSASASARGRARAEPAGEAQRRQQAAGMRPGGGVDPGDHRRADPGPSGPAGRGEATAGADEDSAGGAPGPERQSRPRRRRRPGRSPGRSPGRCLGERAVRHHAADATRLRAGGADRRRRHVVSGPHGGAVSGAERNVMQPPAVLAGPTLDRERRCGKAFRPGGLNAAHPWRPGRSCGGTAV